MRTRARTVTLSLAGRAIPVPGDPNSAQRAHGRDMDLVQVEGVGVVPRHLLEGLMAHVVHGRAVGGFLTAVLSNDLMEAMGRADLVSTAHLHDLVSVCYNVIPRECWRTPGNVTRWQEAGGWEGTYPDKDTGRALRDLAAALAR